MSDIILYLGICAAGYLAAIPLRKMKGGLYWLGTLQTIAVLLLVFTMGARIGANDEIVENLGTYGLYALIFVAGTMAGSLLFVSFVRRRMGIDRYGLMEQNEKAGDFGKQEDQDTAPFGGADHMTLYILGVVILGVLAGFFIFKRIFSDYDSFNAAASAVIRIALCALLVFVGLDLGIKGGLLENFKAVGLRVLAVPAAVIAGTLASSAVIGLFLPVGVKTSLAIGAGMGWYSLAAGMLMDAGMMEAGAISFMYNVMRELFSIVLIPVVAKKIGYVETVALPGAAAMDVCLPIVVRATGSDIAIYSFISGLVTTMAVPVLVPLFF